MARPKKIRIDGENNEVMPVREVPVFVAGIKHERDDIVSESAKVDAPKRTRSRMRGKPLLFVENPDPNFIYRWPLDTPGNLEAMEEAGWEFVMKNGAPLKRSAGDCGTGNCQWHYAMRITKEWWDEDRLEEKKENEQRFKALINPSTKSSNYVPKGQKGAILDLGKERPIN